MSCPGIRALLQITRRNFRSASTYELGFILGPRLNAAGRLKDMSLGIECLITDDESRAFEIALQLDALNRKRQEIEVGMQAEALAMLESSALPAQSSQESTCEPDRNSLCLLDTRWHQGVIGILASRLKDRFHRPVIVFAPGSEAELKGCGDLIPGFHLRDSLDLISKRHPGLLLKFGGHAAAAGLTIQAHHFKSSARLSKRSPRRYSLRLISSAPS